MGKSVYAKYRKNKKGSEKPIEIFIALFVILAVAMVLLKMFGGQITSKQKELKDLADENKLEQMRKDIKSHCQSKCADIETTIDKVTYCKTQYSKEADLNNNGITNEFNQEFSIVGVCEDSIYCAAVTDCKSLTMKNCAKILCQYFQDEWSLSANESTQRLKEFIEPGSCTMTEDEKSRHWYYMIEEELNCEN